MDLNTLGPLLMTALVALGALGQFLGRRARRERRENRRLRHWVQEADVWMFHLERAGWTQRGLRAPGRPPMLEVGHDDAPDVDEAPTDPHGGEPGDRGRPRHAHR